MHGNRHGVFQPRPGSLCVALAWLPYLPIPGLALIAVWIEPDNPHTRFHAWQGGTLVVAGFLLVLLLGMLGLLSDAAWYGAVIGTLSGLILLGVLVGSIWGIVSAARGRYDRLRPVWDVLAAMH